MVVDKKSANLAEESDTYVHASTRREKGTALVSSIRGVQTLKDALLRTAADSGNLKFLGQIRDNGSIRYYTYAEVARSAEALAGFLAGRLEKRESIIGICAENRPEWTIAEYSSYFFGAINCPIYPSFGWPAVRHILEETQMEALFVSSKNLEKLLPAIKADKEAANILPPLVISMDALSIEVENTLRDRDVEIQYFWNILEKELACNQTAEQNNKPEDKTTKHKKKDRNESFGEASHRSAELTADSVATICYTSGTTGVPKGAMLTHRNFISVAAAFQHLSYSDSFFPLQSQNKYLSFLPLAHVFERVVETTLMLSRCTIIYYRGNPKMLQKDFETVKPHYFIGVPRVFNSVKQAIERKAKERGFLLNAIFVFALFLSRYCRNRVFREALGQTVFRSVRNAFGGSVQCFLSGSAPLAPEIAEFFECLFNCKVFEGYGQTETAAGNITTNLSTEEKGVIGIPFPNIRVKLLSRPELGARTEEGKGEILIQGPAVFLGYYKQDKLTRDVFHDNLSVSPMNHKGDKWIKTGDLAEITSSGNIRIIGRSKEIFKLSQGEYIVPEKIENCFLARKIQGVEDITILGDSRRDYLIALLCVSPAPGRTRQDIEESVKKEGALLVAAGHLIKIEVPKRFIYAEEPFSVDNALLTPSVKKARKKILEKYGEMARAAYENE